MDGNERKRPVRGTGNGTRGNDSFLSWLREPGNPSDRQRWLAWAAMVSLMATAAKPVRQRWHRYFHRLSVIKLDTTMNESARCEAFIALLKEARPAAPLRGRPRDDNSGFLANFTEIRDLHTPAWPKGKFARADAAAAVERRIIPDEFWVPFELERADRNVILALRTPSAAALRILSHTYG
jgi:hypothetical protein